MLNIPALMLILDKLVNAMVLRFYALDWEIETQIGEHFKKHKRRNISVVQILYKYWHGQSMNKSRRYWRLIFCKMKIFNLYFCRVRHIPFRHKAILDLSHKFIWFSSSVLPPILYRHFVCNISIRFWNNSEEKN